MLELEVIRPRNSARDVAAAIRKIASERNILRLGASDRETFDPAVYQSSVSAFSEQATEMLERQSVTAVGFNESNKTVYVYTSKKINATQLKALPFNISDDVKVEYRQSKPLVVADNDIDDFTGTSPYEFINDLYACGSSISPGNSRSAGTLGALVRGVDGTLYGLTNNHVTGGCNNARVGLPVVAPGIMDVQVGFQDPFTIGWHHSVLQMRQGDPSAVNYGDNTDAALFRLNPRAALSSSQGGIYDTPTSVVDPTDDMVVEKFGRTTKHTKGHIESQISGPFPVTYKATVWHSALDSTVFHGQVFFEPVYLIRGEGGPFSMPGDSGSLVVTRDGKDKLSAVGLVFAGRLPNETHMLPLRPILDRFGVDLVGGLGV